MGIRPGKMTVRTHEDGNINMNTLDVLFVKMDAEQAFELYARVVLRTGELEKQRWDYTCKKGSEDWGNLMCEVHENGMHRRQYDEVERPMGLTPGEQEGEESRDHGRPSMLVDVWMVGGAQAG